MIIIVRKKSSLEKTIIKDNGGINYDRQDKDFDR